jgi:hypothetical protein
MKSTLKRESKELEVVEREAIVISNGSQFDSCGLLLYERLLRGIQIWV